MIMMLMPMMMLNSISILSDTKEPHLLLIFGISFDCFAALGCHRGGGDDDGDDDNDNGDDDNDDGDDDDERDVIAAGKMVLTRHPVLGATAHHCRQTVHSNIYPSVFFLRFASSIQF